MDGTRANEDHASGVKTPLPKERSIAGDESPACRSRTVIISLPGLRGETWGTAQISEDRRIEVRGFPPISQGAAKWMGHGSMLGGRSSLDGLGFAVFQGLIDSGPDFVLPVAGETAHLGS